LTGKQSIGIYQSILTGKQPIGNKHRILTENKGIKHISHFSENRRRHEGRLLKCLGGYEPKKELATAFHFYACMLTVLTQMTYSDFPLKNNC